MSEEEKNVIVSPEQGHFSFIDELEKDEESGGGEKEGLKDGEGAEKEKEGKEADAVSGDKEAGKVEKEGEGEGEGEAKVKAEPKVEDDDELKTLRQLAREQKRQLDKVTAALDETNKRLQDAAIIPPEEVEKKKELEAFAAQRQDQLDYFLEAMKVHPKYEDVEVVVSQAHFDDIVEAMGKVLVSNEGGKLDDAVKRIESEIWAMRNPYKFMYDTIKAYHPDYTKVVKPAEGEAKGEAKPSKENLSAEKVAMSIQEIGGGSSEGSGWTAAKIDDLDELEIDKVPRDIYDKYLRGELK